MYVPRVFHFFTTVVKASQKESKEAWLASHNFGMDHGGSWGRFDGLMGLGAAINFRGRPAPVRIVVA